MSPLEILVELLGKYGHIAWVETVRSLAAREEARVEGFWRDLGAAEIWGRVGSLAALDLSRGQDVDAAAYARDLDAFRRALWRIADDMSLRGVANHDSDWWAERLRPER